MIDELNFMNQFRLSANGKHDAERNGGYTRILKLGPRRSDSTEMVYLELVEGAPAGETAPSEPAASESS